MRKPAIKCLLQKLFVEIRHQLYGFTTLSQAVTVFRFDSHFAAFRCLALAIELVMSVKDKVSVVLVEFNWFCHVLSQNHGSPRSLKSSCSQYVLN